MIFQQTRTVKLSETDATGIVYFTNLFKYAAELFEEFWLRKNLSFLFPIVHADGQFKKMVTFGDTIEVTLMTLKVNQTSLSAYYTILQGNQMVAEVTLTHVALDRVTKEKVNLRECENLHDWGF